MLVRKFIVVRVMDLTITLSLTAMVGLARVKGLKFRTVEMILLAIDALVRTREPRLLSVAVTINASL